MTRKPHREHHRSARTGWLRAAVLGANDGILSTGALVVGVAATGARPGAILASGVAGVVAGAVSMAAGEYVSVRSQVDVERADLAIEKRELAENPGVELQELANIYVKRGLSRKLAQQVAEELTATDALDAHARDELGITETQRPRPVQAALASAASFTVGSLLPLSGLLVSPLRFIQATTIGLTLLSLVLTGAVASYTGGASMVRGAARLLFWGALAMLATSLIGRLFNVPA